MSAVPAATAGSGSARRRAIAVFGAELGLAAGQLGRLGGAYLLGFALMQLPLGSAPHCWSAKRVPIAFLAVAVGGCRPIGHRPNPPAAPMAAAGRSLPIPRSCVSRRSASSPTAA